MLYLRDLARQNEQTRKLVLGERLPSFILEPCILNVTFSVELKNDFYLILLKVTGEIDIVCQRCLHDFVFPYENQTSIAVCRDEERAEMLMEHYECTVSSSDQVVLEDLIIDELHLYAQQFHPNLNNCSTEYS